MSDMVEVRWHGRGGQGAKTASYILAVAAAEQGWQVQAFPEYGAERRGAAAVSRPPRRRAWPLSCAPRRSGSPCAAAPTSA